MATDPICGMTVDETSALRVERDGQTFYFCGEHCRQTFLAQPSAPAIQAKTEDSHCAPTGHEHSHARERGEGTKPSAKYFCSMCPGVESDEPGDCPKCGMALDRNPARQPPTAEKAIYTCPMHPEVQQDK